MHFDAALNIAWLLLGAVALGSTLRASSRSACNGNRMPRWLQLVGVASIVVALFPYISATDDLIRIANSQPQSSQNTSTQHGPAADLLRLYEVSDAPLITAINRFAVTFAFVCLLFVAGKRELRRSVPQRSGRAPPSFPAFV